MVTFQLAEVESFNHRQEEISVVWFEKQEDNEVRCTKVLKPDAFRPVHIALRGEVTFKLNCGKKAPAPYVPSKNTQIVFGMVGDTWFWALAKEYNELARIKLYQIVKKGKIIWQGRDLDAVEIAEVYNPRTCQKRGVRARWRESLDNGKTYQSCICPTYYDRQFDSKGNRTIPSKSKKAA